MSEQKRRSADGDIAELVRLVSDSIVEANRQRGILQAIIEQQGKEIKSQGNQIRCLASGFKKFEPYLTEKMMERKDNAQFIHDKKALWKGRIFDVFVVAVVGSFAFAAVNFNKAKEFISALWR